MYKIAMILAVWVLVVLVTMLPSISCINKTVIRLPVTIKTLSLSSMSQCSIVCMRIMFVCLVSRSMLSSRGRNCSTWGLHPRSLYLHQKCVWRNVYSVKLRLVWCKPHYLSRIFASNRMRSITVVGVVVRFFRLSKHFTFDGAGLQLIVAWNARPTKHLREGAIAQVTVCFKGNVVLFQKWFERRCLTGTTGAHVALVFQPRIVAWAVSLHLILIEQCRSVNIEVSFNHLECVGDVWPINFTSSLIVSQLRTWGS